MNVLEIATEVYRNVYDRSQWLKGPWQDEDLDKVAWTDLDTDLDCLVVRNHFGVWCGYVGVPPGHPWYEVGYDSCVKTPPCMETFCDHVIRIDVHGGLTFAGGSTGGLLETSISRILPPGRPDPWWLGFDCSHAFDIVPGLTIVVTLYPGQTYKDFNFATDEVTGLAQQAHDARKIGVDRFGRRCRQLKLKTIVRQDDTRMYQWACTCGWRSELSYTKDQPYVSVEHLSCLI